MGLGLKINLKPAHQTLGELAARQVPFASALALTMLAEGVQSAETDEENKTFDNPTPFTQRAFGKVPARKTRLIATVFIKDPQASYLAPYVLGGARYLGDKKGMIVPIGQRTNQYGNLPKSTLARLKAKPGVFIGPVTLKNGRTINGVWQRSSKPKAGKRTKGAPSASAGSKLTLLIQFQDTTEAPKHLDFYGRARAHVAKYAVPVFTAALNKAMATARK